MFDLNSLVVSEFLLKYTLPYEMDQNGITGVKLRPVENGSACQFMNPEGCDVYADRLLAAITRWPCCRCANRMNTGTQSYALMKEEHRLGHNEPRKITIDAYRKEQGLEEYDELARG